MYDLISHGSYIAIVLVLTLTGIGLPLPEEVPVIAAGVLSANGTLNPWLAYIACVIGAVCGDSVMYAVGYHFGRSFIKEHSWLSGFLTDQREKRIEQMITRHGVFALFLARFMVGVRSPVYLTAGIMRVRYRWFLVIDIFCALIVVGAFFALAYKFGANISTFIRNAEVGITITALVVLIVGVSIYYLRRRQLSEIRHHNPSVASGDQATEFSTSNTINYSVTPAMT